MVSKVKRISAERTLFEILPEGTESVAKEPSSYEGNSPSIGELS